MTGNISAKADKAAAKKPKKVSKYSKRKVDPAFYWMTIPAMILVCIFLYLPFLQGAMYSFTNSQGYGDYKFIGFKNYIAMFQDARVGHAYLFTIFIAIWASNGICSRNRRRISTSSPNGLPNSRSIVNGSLSTPSCIPTRLIRPCAWTVASCRTRPPRSTASHS